MESLHHTSMASSMTVIPFPIVACRVFRVTFVGSTVIVAAKSDLEDYRYQDVHDDMGRITDLLLNSELRGLIIDLGGHFHAGAVLTDALTSFSRAVGGKGVLVGVSPDMECRLEELRLRKMWHVVPTLEEGLSHLGVTAPGRKHD